MSHTYNIRDEKGDEMEDNREQHFEHDDKKLPPQELLKALKDMKGMQDELVNNGIV